jgi:F0F1-type ATP synthase membrane subunit a
MILNVITNNPVTFYGLVGVLLSILIWVLDLQYDEEGLSGFLFWISEVFRFPFWLVGEFLHSFVEQISVGMRLFMTFVGGILLCIAIDFGFRKVKSSLKCVKRNRKLDKR